MRLPCLLLLLSLVAACGDAPDGKTSDAPKDWSGPASGQKQGTGRLDRSHAGTPAPAVLFEDPAGEPASIADFRGKPVLLNLWATWCAPCIVEMPGLDRLASTNDAVKVLTLSQDMNGQEKVDAFFAKNKFEKLEPYIDPELAMMAALNANTLPTTILYDGSGREVWRMTGMEDWTGPRAAELIAEVAPSPSAVR